MHGTAYCDGDAIAFEIGWIRTSLYTQTLVYEDKYQHQLEIDPSVKAVIKRTLCDDTSYPMASPRH